MKNTEKLKAPFVYFGGKMSIAKFVWQLFGTNAKHYFEPFAGSLAVLLSRPVVLGEYYSEIVNDLDCFIANLWNAIKYDPELIVKYCDHPISQIRQWGSICSLVSEKQTLLQKMLEDPEYFDAKLAGYYLYKNACEIGSIDLEAVDVSKVLDLENKIGISNGRPNLVRPNGIQALRKKDLLGTLCNLSTRLKFVKITCLDWKRLFNDGTSWQDENAKKDVAIFLDPPYGDINRRKLYRMDSFSVASEVTDFCVKHAFKKSYKIVVAGYEGEHNDLEDLGYTKYTWLPNGGYGNFGVSNGRENKHKERLWASQSCEKIDLGGLNINEYLKNVA